MSPEERQLLAGLFDRTRNAAGQARDRDAEAFIGDAVRAQPYAPYLLAQTVLVQEQALRAANDRLQQLEAQVQELSQRAAAQPQQGGFLGGLGSLFGGGQPPQPAPRQAPPQQGNPWGGAPPQQGMQGGPQGAGMQGGGTQGGPWGGAPQQQPAGGGFLKGALGAAAGVAGGVLLADSIRGLFHGSNNPLGIGSGHGSGSGSQQAGGGDTVINNYYGDDRQQASGDDYSDDNYVSDADFTGDPSDDDDSFDV